MHETEHRRLGEPGGTREHPNGGAEILHVADGSEYASGNHTR
jgi:hypothetical protein